MKFSRNTIFLTIAHAIALLHAGIVALILFGWIFPSIYSLYITALILTFLSDIFFSSCILSKWEFLFRKKVHPHIDYDYAYTTYYARFFTKQHLHKNFLPRVGMIFTALSLVIQIFFHWGVIVHWVRL